jgi:hypothetical protein
MQGEARERVSLFQSALLSQFDEEEEYAESSKTKHPELPNLRVVIFMSLNMKEIKARWPLRCAQEVSGPPIHVERF